MDTQRDEFLKLAEAICLHMPGWSIQPVDNWDTAVEFTNAAESLTFRLSLNCHDKRLHVIPIYQGLQKYLPYPAQMLRISISPTRPPATIAADIARRFIPNFRQEIESCRQAAAQHKAIIDQVEANAYAIIQASSSNLHRRSAHKDGMISLSGSLPTQGNGHCHFTFEVYPHNSTLTVHGLCTELAIRIAAALTECSINPPAS